MTEFCFLNIVVHHLQFVDIITHYGVNSGFNPKMNLSSSLSELTVPNSPLLFRHRQNRHVHL